MVLNLRSIMLSVATASSRRLRSTAGILFLHLIFTGCADDADLRNPATKVDATHAADSPVEVARKSLTIVKRSDGLQELSLKGHFTHRVVAKRAQDGGLHPHCGATTSSAADEGAEQ